MKNSEKFINWLEGYLDACRNVLDTSQVKIIRKKIKECQDESTSLIHYQPTSTTGSGIIPLYDNQKTTFDQNFLEEIERNKNASTLDELFESTNTDSKIF
jgi:hypothetical protein